MTRSDIGWVEIPRCGVRRGLESVRKRSLTMVRRCGSVERFVQAFLGKVSLEGHSRTGTAVLPSSA